MSQDLAARVGFSRRPHDRMIAGVAGGIADRLGIPAMYVRAAFVILSLVWGLGAFLYAGAWGATIDRVGRSVPLSDHVSSRQIFGLGVSLFGLLLFLRGVLPWPGDDLVWPVAIVVMAGAVIAERKLDILKLADPRYARARIVVGAGFVLGGLVLLGDLDPALVAPGLVAALLTVAGMAIAAGPWLYKAIDDLARERRERIRQEERADMAAHLHDSVLQTLAMIQRTDDPKRVATLARAQERELRRWLFESEADASAESLAGAVRAAADRVESDFDVAVEVVTVGDVPLDDSMRALAGAAGEAITNAAKHSGADRVSVFIEVGESQVELFVTDQGKGFDPTTVPDHRRGLSESIVRRVERHGGTAQVESEAGGGTEIHLRMGVSPE